MTCVCVARGTSTAIITVAGLRLTLRTEHMGVRMQRLLTVSSASTARQNRINSVISMAGPGDTAAEPPCTPEERILSEMPSPTLMR